MMECIKCADCIHDGVCYLQEVTNDIDKQLKDFGCDDYKNKADFVEVVRCKKCKYSDVGIAAKSIDGQERIVWYCKLEQRIIYADWYCPSGIRK